jgi:spore germination protein KC
MVVKPKDTGKPGRSRRRLWLLALAIPLATGCWGRQEVNDIGIVTATALDRNEEGELELTLLLAVPRLIGTSSFAGGGGETKLSTTAGWVVTERGETVLEAYRHLQAKLPRTIVFSHNRVLVIGERLAKAGVAPALDFFQRHRQAQLNSYVAVAKHPVDILRFRPKFEKLTSEIIEEEIVRGVGTQVHLVEFLAMLHEEGQEAYAPVVEMATSTEEGKGEEKSLVSSKRTAAFRGDRLAGVYGDEATRGLLWIRDEIRDGVITVPVPEDRGGGKISAVITSGTTKLRPIAKDDGIEFRIDADATVDVSENASSLSINDALDEVETWFEQDLERRIRGACERSQKQLRTDVLGFGQQVYRNYPRLWKTKYAERWEETFPGVRTDVRVSVRIVQTGLIGKETAKERGAKR